MTVTLAHLLVPSRAVVLACGGFLDQWAALGTPLSVRALRAAGAGGGHLRDWLAEAVAVPAGPGKVTVTARIRPGVHEPGDVIAGIDVDLDLPWPAISAGPGPVTLGDLPVDPCGMVIGDAAALDSWVGFLPAARSVDGLADLRIDGRGAEEARARYGAQPLPAIRGGQRHGWLNLPVAVAFERAAEINEWAVGRGHAAHLAHVDPHSHHHLGGRAGRQDPLGAGVIEVAGCPILCVGWAPGEVRRFAAGRTFGQVFPVTLEDVGGRATLRWSVPPAPGP
ncbi:hypothetical protein Aph02nite_30460 [Actinoplanes philippinensis]|uniref:Uncharacterized protein n=1 Tax=Actinoplanes philippinensis TaxID=35752 RepID=A0A1I2EC81_9ACTN|nr:hypothetical protein [Actinoplanes philippinensis]GIE77096.1 hypothetical protein Aph02nite_30460 [Actinoplanes philippinensis]SFE90562.1 hypothetical protein SAMN05421541_104360 [Actinoplanes philippinensis]